MIFTFEEWRGAYLGMMAQAYGPWGIPFHVMAEMNDHNLRKIYKTVENTVKEESMAKIEFTPPEKGDEPVTEAHILVDSYTRRVEKLLSLAPMGGDADVSFGSYQSQEGQIWDEFKAKMVDIRYDFRNKLLKTREKWLKNHPEEAVRVALGGYSGFSKLN